MNEIDITRINWKCHKCDVGNGTEEHGAGETTNTGCTPDDIWRCPSDSSRT
jgi:hypothetical protein